MIHDNRHSIASALLQVGAVKLNPTKPFTYASGLCGPIYCDNRILLSHHLKRDYVIKMFIHVLTESKIQFDTIAGVATAGIPYAAIVADHLKKPLVYVRSKPKEHGKGNQIEGELKEGSRVVLFEDLINQGGSSADAIDALVKAHAKVPLLLSVVDYQMEHAKDHFLRRGVVVHSLTNFQNIVKEAINMGLISESDERLLLDWQKDPVHWDKIARKT